MRWPWGSTDVVAASPPSYTVTPLTVKDLEGAVAVVLKVPPTYTPESAEELRYLWTETTKGTLIQGLKVFVVTDDIDIEIIRKQVA